jgi:uncharacterized transporter YbjL
MVNTVTKVYVLCYVVFVFMFILYIYLYIFGSYLQGNSVWDIVHHKCNQPMNIKVGKTRPNASFSHSIFVWYITLIAC